MDLSQIYLSVKQDSQPLSSKIQLHAYEKCSKSKYRMFRKKDPKVGISKEHNYLDSIPECNAKYAMTWIKNNNAQIGLTSNEQQEAIEHWCSDTTKCNARTRSSPIWQTDKENIKWTYIHVSNLNGQNIPTNIKVEYYKSKFRKIWYKIKYIASYHKKLF